NDTGRGGRLALLAIPVAAAAALLVAFLTGVFETASTSGSATEPPAQGQLSARVERVIRAADDDAPGFEVQAPGAEDFAAGAPGMEIEAGASVRTDARTRVVLSLADGSEVALNHNTVLILSDAAP